MMSHEQSAVKYAARNLGPEWPTVLKLSGALERGWRIPEIPNLEDAQEQLRNNVSVNDFEHSAVLAEAIKHEWKLAQGKRSGIARLMQLSRALESMDDQGDGEALKQIIEQFVGKSIAALQDDPEIRELVASYQRLQKEHDEATTDYGRESVGDRMERLHRKLNDVATAKQAELNRPKKSFHLAAQIVALGRGSVSDEIYDLVTGIPETE